MSVKQVARPILTCDTCGAFLDPYPEEHNAISLRMKAAELGWRYLRENRIVTIHNVKAPHKRQSKTFLDICPSCPNE